MKIGAEERTNCILYQIGALKAFLDAEGVPLNHSSHGALYGWPRGCRTSPNAWPYAADFYKMCRCSALTGMLHEKVYRRRVIAFVARTTPISTTMPRDASSHA